MDEDIMLNEVLALMSGIDATGEPLAAGTLTLNKMNQESKLNTEQEVNLSAAIYTTNVSGGCAVITADIPNDFQSQYQYAKRLLQNHLESIQNEETKEGVNELQILSLILVPFLMEGHCYLVLNQPVFCDGYPLKNGRSRLIIAFDVSSENSAMLYGADMDLNEYRTSAEMEADETTRQLDDEFDELMAEKENLEKNDEYIENISALLNSGLETADKDNDGYVTIRPGVRYRNEQSEEK